MTGHARLSLNPDVSDLTALRSYGCWCAQDRQSNGRGLGSIGLAQIRRGPEIHQVVFVGSLDLSSAILSHVTLIPHPTCAQYPCQVDPALDGRMEQPAAFAHCMVVNSCMDDSGCGRRIRKRR